MQPRAQQPTPHKHGAARRHAPGGVEVVSGSRPVVDLAEELGADDLVKHVCVQGERTRQGLEGSRIFLVQFFFGASLCRWAHRFLAVFVLRS
jgi:hypothetical protein